jgi:hypothetical protein
MWMQKDGSRVMMDEKNVLRIMLDEKYGCKGWFASYDG